MKQKVEEDTQTMIYSMSLQVLLEEYVLFAELSEIEISGMCCDSRKVQHGDLFLAYPGESGADGRDYIQQAIKNGASAVLSEPLNSQDAITMMNCREVENNIGVPVIPIHDLRNKSGLLATKFYGYPSRQMQMIGVTGTNGKTSISYLIGKICQGLKISTPIIGTFGSGFTSNSLQAHGLTTPDCISLQKELTKFRDQGAEMVAMEVSSHAISQQRVKGIHYDVKVFTNCSRDHLDYHGSMQEYINAKKQFFSDKDFNYMVVNLDDPVGLELAQVYNESVKVIGISKKTIPLSCHKNMVIAGVASSINGLTIKFDGDWGAGIINSQLIGDFNAFNLIAAITTLLCSGVSMTSILSVVNKIAHIPGRMEYYGGGSLPTVVVDYAHTPDA
ncbi:MAG: UDP-N-acetylmuramoyl-L-alanyl-D-glutamate--2,6-diaminopimelate ligase, partial [Gammaproteobacteria bacterium]|nr:UDP-N-acetylmuramoyl-L-alanyl-D-glutamate--2,6-diaminopimelate ligase [Gammaproteobacteria bacterium]